jgi:hydroxypyruvate isomerase
MAKNNFKLKYASHFGMFQNSAGKDVIDSLNLWLIMVLWPLEDNGMMGRPVEQQEAIAKK